MTPSTILRVLELAATWRDALDLALVVGAAVAWAAIVVVSLALVVH